MKEIAAAEFHAHSRELLDQLDTEGLLITKDGEPIAKVVPFRGTNADLLGSMRGEIEILGDMTSTGLDWEAGA